MTAKGVLVVPIVAMHAKFRPFCCGTTLGQKTLAWMWRSARMLCLIASATWRVFRIAVGVERFGVVVLVEFVDEPDEPQALNSAAVVSVIGPPVMMSVSED